MMQIFLLRHSFWRCLFTTLIETGMLHNNDNNSIFISNPFNKPRKEQAIVNNKGSEENSDVNETSKSSPANDSIQSNEDTSSFLTLS